MYVFRTDIIGKMNDHRASTSSVSIPETELLISQLERGTVVTKFSYRKKPEKKNLTIRRETRQIVWQKTSKGMVDGAGKCIVEFGIAVVIGFFIMCNF